MTDLTHITEKEIRDWANEAATKRWADGKTTIANLTTDKAKEKDNG